MEKLVKNVAYIYTQLSLSDATYFLALHCCIKSVGFTFAIVLIFGKPTSSVINNKYRLKLKNKNS